MILIFISIFTNILDKHDFFSFYYYAKYYGKFDNCMCEKIVEIINLINFSFVLNK